MPAQNRGSRKPPGDCKGATRRVPKDLAGPHAVQLSKRILPPGRGHAVPAYKRFFSGYPKRGNSTNATAHVHHKIPDASVFEEGATIRGRPRKLIALPSAPQRLGRKPMTPELFRQRIGPLAFVNRAGKKPLLFAKAKAGRDTTNISLPRFRSGCRGEGPFTSVAVFVGVDSVSVRKQLNIARIIRQARDRLLQLYKASFQ